MTAKNQTPLTPRERLTRGLTYTAVGPVDVTRGLVGLGAHSAQAGASNLRRRRRERRLAADLQSAQESVAGLPQALQQVRHRGNRLWLITGVVAVALTGGAVAFSVVRRSSRPEPSLRPPSVDVQQHP